MQLFLFHCQIISLKLSLNYLKFLKLSENKENKVKQSYILLKQIKKLFVW